MHSDQLCMTKGNFARCRPKDREVSIVNTVSLSRGCYMLHLFHSTVPMSLRLWSHESQWYMVSVCPARSYILCQDSDCQTGSGGFIFPCKCRPGTQKWCPCNGSVILIARAVILETRGQDMPETAGACTYSARVTLLIHMLLVQHLYENLADVPPKTETSVRGSS
jgi:hypothetical protein